MMAAEGSYFVSGIGTGVGKTLLSAILVEALKADYWKPVQAGGLDATDLMEVKSLVSNSESVFHSEVYRLPFPVSPHASAERSGIKIDPTLFQPPKTNNRLIIEGAGGLLVPLNRKLMLIDLIGLLGLPVILVSRHYLGSINHTLLSVEALKTRRIPIRGILFNGEQNRETESIIEEISQVPILGRVSETKMVNKEFVATEALKFKLL